MQLGSGWTQVKCSHLLKLCASTNSYYIININCRLILGNMLAVLFQENVRQCKLSTTEDIAVFHEFGLINPQHWNAFSLASHPGLCSWRFNSSCLDFSCTEWFHLLLLLRDLAELLNIYFEPLQAVILSTSILWEGKWVSYIYLSSYTCLTENASCWFVSKNTDNQSFIDS